jgi:hypothetical protein
MSEGDMEHGSKGFDNVDGEGNVVRTLLLLLWWWWV